MRTAKKTIKFNIKMYWPIYHLREPINKAKTMHLIATYCNILVQETISMNSHRQQQRKPVEMFFLNG
jgi:hypothetical protein